MTFNPYMQSLWNELDATWDLCLLVNELPESLRSDTVKVWFEFFSSHPLVNIELTQHESSLDSTELRVFCKNKYGVHFNDEMKMWVPFRHGDVDYGQFLVN